MLAIAQFLTEYRSTFTFGLIYGLFTLATYASLKTGVLSVAAVTFGAISGFMYAALLRDHGLALLWGLAPFPALAGAIAAFLLSLVVLRLQQPLHGFGDDRVGPHHEGLRSSTWGLSPAARTE